MPSNEELKASIEFLINEIEENLKDVNPSKEKTNQKRMYIKILREKQDLLDKQDKN